jgi:hypothetical protein
VPQKRLGNFDQETGEVLDGVLVLVGRRIGSPYGRQWMQINQDALAEIAADPEMGTEAFRVFLYLNARLDFENLIQVPQTDIAVALGMTKQSVNRAIRLLEAKQIILRGPQVGRSSSWKLNVHYGWKGKVTQLRQEQARQLRLVADSVPRGKDADASGEPS